MTVNGAHRTVRVATAQFYSHTNVPENLELCRKYIKEAAAAEARLIVLPENANRTRTDYVNREKAFDLCESLDGDFMNGLRVTAKELKIFIVVGVDLKTEVAPHCNIGVVLIGDDGELLYVHHKTALWDYEYGIFTAGSKDIEVIQTSIGKIGLLSCADGILPEVPRLSALKGAEILCNSLNSRGPDEMRSHEPLRAIENHVWMVAANSVGGPEDAYPWTGGSQIISPLGETLACAGETDYGMVWADITPETSYPKILGGGIGSFDLFRRPDLYQDLVAPIDSLPAAKMYGPVAKDAPKRPLQVATLQLSWYHSTVWTVTRTVGQITYAASRGVQLGVFPELFCFKPGQVEADPGAAVKLSTEVLGKIQIAAAESSIFVVANLVEREGEAFYSTAYLVDNKGQIAGSYRKIHLGESERTWATPGHSFAVVHTEIGVIGLMIGNEVWLPEVARILSLRGAEVIAHPANWDRVEAATMAAVERTEENKTHLISSARTDNPAVFGSQIVTADRFRPGQCIALMRYPTAIWSRTGFEENIFLELDLQDSHSKMMGVYLDTLATRQPKLYGAFVETPLVESRSSKG
jgi:predicted amidohydrolase